MLGRYLILIFLMASRNFEPVQGLLRYCVTFSFHSGVGATEVHRHICSVYGEDILTLRTVERWFAKFCNREFDMLDKRQSGHSSCLVVHSLLAELGKNS
ncbi:hypothetical protein M513_02248 [Trichuris suis]|uniref:Mos1 transposase HTH domain-containing protein n=1 Tax=Trichuris suis TaxID=68888 RepID=A0A085MIE5_9BILA|nr:hypothetical protein M513_02248 [Trichuris suis]